MATYDLEQAKSALIFFPFTNLGMQSHEHDDN